MDAGDHNFSHRIDQFSFGRQSHAGIVQPLQGDEKIADKNFMNYQYFVQVVPTEVLKHRLLYNINGSGHKSCIYQIGTLAFGKQGYMQGE